MSKELTNEQRIKMMEQIRHYSRTGRPEKAMPIRAALDAGKFLVVNENADKVVDDAPSRNAKREVWLKYAKKISDIDEEILDEQSRGDLIKMLEVNGLLDS